MTKFAYFCGNEQWQPEELVEHAVLAENAGFDMVLISEHFHPWVDDFGASGFAFSTLGAIAAMTNRVRLGTAVTTPLFRFHPAVVAQAAATIDRLSAGRFVLGVGTGENINEGPLGHEFPGYSERASRMSEALEIMRRLLDGEKLEFSGRHYSTDKAKLYSPPVGEVPIWLAASGPKSAKMAGRLTEGVITSVRDPEKTRENVVDPVRESASAAGRPSPTVVATRWVIYAENDSEAWDVLKPWRGLRAPGRLEAIDPQTLRERADAMDKNEILSQYSVAPDLDSVVTAYEPLVTALDADIVTIQMAASDQRGLIADLGEYVLPRLRSLNS